MLVFCVRTLMLSFSRNYTKVIISFGRMNYEVLVKL